MTGLALREGADCGFNEVVMVEFHYYADRDRGPARQIPYSVYKVLGKTFCFKRSGELSSPSMAVLKVA